MRTKFFILMPAAMSLAQPNLATRLMGLRQVIKETPMPLPAGFPYPLNQVVEIPLEQIIPNPEQPRRSMRRDTLEELAASMKVKGQEVPAPVRPLTEAERASHPGTWIMLVGGHRRRLAALMNQFKTLKVIVKDLTPEETHHAAVTDNLHEEMDWWDWDLAIEKEAQSTRKSQKDMEGWMGKSDSKIYRAFTITKALNEAARALVDENLGKTLKNESSPRSTKNKGFLITEENLLVLAGLEDPELVLQGLQVVLDEYLAPAKTQELVKHIQAGYPIENFGKVPKPALVIVPQPASNPAEAGLPKNPILAEPSVPKPSHPPAAAHPATTSPQKKPETSNPSPDGDKSQQPSFFWEWMAGISFIGQIRSKLKKSETMTGGEKALVLSWRFVEGLGWLVKHFFKLFHTLWKLFWKLLKEADRLVEKLFGKTVSNLVHLVLAIAIVWGLWYGYHHNPLRQLNGLVSKVLAAVWSSGASPLGGPSASVQPAPMAATPAAIPVAPAKPAAKINPQSQPVLAAQTEDVASIKDELAGLPYNIVIKPFAYNPGAMNDDMSLSRMSDLQDGEKYTVRLGGDKQKVMAITPSFSKCAIILKSGLLGLLESTSHLEIYWEDVKEIHTSVIEVGSRQMYQLSLLATGLKKPLTVQCSTAENLERLVSALEFKLKASRGSAAPITAMPYLNQGLRLNKDGFVTTLWADSPLEKVGVKLGEIPWSLEKDTPKQQKVADLENELQSLASGGHTLYKVTANQWAAAVKNTVADDPKTFRPYRRTVKFTVF